MQGQAVDEPGRMCQRQEMFWRQPLVLRDLQPRQGLEATQGETGEQVLGLKHYADLPAFERPQKVGLADGPGGRSGRAEGGRWGHAAPFCRPARGFRARIRSRRG